MVLSDISVPEVYKTSADFRFFLKWFEYCLSKIQSDTENLIDLLDPLRCPSDLLWMLADTCGFKYDERVPIAFNRLVILNFPNLIRNRGSQIGMVYAAEINLAQFRIINQDVPKNSQLAERLEDTSIAVNSANIIPHTDLGYIDVVYVSENVPVDTCIEYVRPLGMYCFASAGVQVNAKTKISVDARITNMMDTGNKVNPTFVGHYRRSDYASLQKPVGKFFTSDFVNYTDPQSAYEEVSEEYLEKRRRVWYRNKKYEEEPSESINPGYRTLYSLQLSNNEHTVRALLPSLEDVEEIFSTGYGPQNVDVVYPDNYLKHKEDPMYNIRLNRQLEESLSPQVSTVDSATDILNPKPAVNPVMASLGDAISLNRRNTKYTKKDPVTGEIIVVDIPDN